VLRPAGITYLMCFSDRQPGDFGPRRVSQRELRETFAAGWTIESISADTQNLLHQTNSLQAQIGKLVTNDGKESTLLQLTGTIPITYRGGSYNIPCTIWLVDGYPTLPPTCYVTPTKEMRIKNGHKHVDMHGMVYLPYLHSWNAQSSLAELVMYMSLVFSEDPPVYRYDPNLSPISSNNSSQSQSQSQSQQQSQQQHNSNNNSNSNINSNSNLANRRGSKDLPQQQPQADQIAARKNKLVQEVTQKLQSSLSFFYKEATEDIDKLFEQQTLLKQSEQNIQQNLSTLREQQGQIENRLALVTSKNEEITSWLSHYENKSLTDIDSLIYPKDTWSQQVLDLVAEDHAIEDTIYVLDRALAEERIDLKTFLKLVRKLASKQFFARALAIKIQMKQQQQQTQHYPYHHHM